MSPARIARMVLLAVFFQIGSVGAEEGGGSPSEQAVLLGHGGLAHFSEGRFRAALAAFTRADQLAHSPVFVLYRARASRELGRLLEARDLYEACAGEGIVEATPDSWRRAVADAASELREVRRQIPSVLIKVRGEARFPLRLADGERGAPLTEPEMEWELDPGLHVLSVIDAQGARITLDVAARVGERGLVVPFDFGRTSPLPKNSAPMAVAPSREVAPEPPPLYRSGAWTALGLGGGAFITSGVSFGMAVKQARAVRDACDANLCPPSEIPRARSAIRWANFATASAVTGALSLATGSALLVVSRRVQRKRAADRSGALELRLHAHPEGVTLSGSF